MDTRLRYRGCGGRAAGSASQAHIGKHGGLENVGVMGADGKTDVDGILQGNRGGSGSGERAARFARRAW